jgi:DNA-binding NarL/FixJ family response regulator
VARRVSGVDMAGPITIAIVDDHPVLRGGMASLLNAEADLEVVDQGETVADAERILAGEAVDVLVLDVRLGTASGFSALAERRPRRPAVVVLTAYAYAQYAQAAMRLGATGFVLKTAPIDELLVAIRNAAAGRLTFGVRPGQPVELSPREFDVVRLVVDGRSNDEVGAALGISTRTVETHLRRIFERLEVASRTELAARALREGWLELPATG